MTDHTTDPTPPRSSLLRRSPRGWPREATDQPCPNCPPPLDCERGIYHPTDRPPTASPEHAATTVLGVALNDGHTRREWTAALRWCAGRIDMERGQARGWEITQDASIWASLIEAGELTPWAETPADPPRIAVEPPAAPDPASVGAAAPGPETAAEGLCRCGLPLPCPRHGDTTGCCRAAHPLAAELDR